MSDTANHEVSRAEYWQQRYEQGYTGWDMRGVSPPLQAYFDQLGRRDLRILIPGAGNAYEAAYLHQAGFSEVYVLDFAEIPLRRFAEQQADFPAEHLVCADFFTWQAEPFDLVVEQTFFCAIDPARRTEYAQKTHRLLKAGGRLVGLLFDCEFKNGPPFSGSRAEYETLFAPYFDFATFETCHNSVGPRAGRELFINLIKK